MNSKVVRVVLVEDQPKLAINLRQQVESIPGFVCCAIAGSVKEGLAIIPACAPDLVILDIELGDGNAFDILNELIPLSFQVIFATAFEQYAIKAIKFGAMDYLLKPIDQLELSDALGRIQNPFPSDAQLELARHCFLHPNQTGRLALRNEGIIKVINITEVMYLNSSDGTRFYLDDGQQILSKKTIKDFEDLLPAHMFCRIHASYLVNIRYIDSFQPPDIISLRNGTQLPVAARRKDGLVTYLVGKHKLP